MRTTAPEVHRAYGTKGFGAAEGDDAYVQDFLLKKERSCAATQSRATSAPPRESPPP